MSRRTLAAAAAVLAVAAPTAAAAGGLPGGGREIFPRFRVVALYGAPQAAELGALGIGTPDRAGRRLRAVAAQYRRFGPVLPAMELLATIANRGAGADGTYRTRQSRAVIRRYLRAARRAGAILILDIQPGRADFVRELHALRPFLVQPDVGVALDPEWSMRAGEVPGETIGSTDAATVNRVSAELARIVRSRRLPQKLLLVHQFTPDMIAGRARLKRHSGVALVVNVDGFGTRSAKVSKYRALTRGSPFRHGLKLFFSEDVGLMAPREVLRLRPRPSVVVYE